MAVVPPPVRVAAGSQPCEDFFHSKVFQAGVEPSRRPGQARPRGHPPSAPRRSRRSTPNTVQSYMGHAPYSTTQRYLHHKPRPEHALHEAFGGAADALKENARLADTP